MTWKYQTQANAQILLKLHHHTQLGKRYTIAQALLGGAPDSVCRQQLVWFWTSSSSILGISYIVSKTMTLFLRWHWNCETFMFFSLASQLTLCDHKIALQSSLQPTIITDLFLLFTVYTEDIQPMLQFQHLLHLMTIDCFGHVLLVSPSFIFCPLPSSLIDSGYMGVPYLSL